MYSLRGSWDPNPTRTTCLKSTGSTRPVCTAVHPIFVTLCLAGFPAKHRSAPPTCIAIRLLFVPQYASHLYPQYFGKMPVAGVALANHKRKGQNEKFMNFAHFCEFWCFLPAKTSAIHISNSCSRTPLGKVHELAFLWFGLPG